MEEKADKYFYSIKDKRKFEIKIKRSTFICSLKYTETINHAKELISAISIGWKHNSLRVSPTVSLCISVE